jgi:hypothetical protein
MGGDRLDRGKDRLHGGDFAEMGPAGGARLGSAGRSNERRPGADKALEGVHPAPLVAVDTMMIFPRSGGHLSKLGMIRAEVMDGEYSTGIHG